MKSFRAQAYSLAPLGHDNEGDAGERRATADEDENCDGDTGHER